MPTTSSNWCVICVVSNEAWVLRVPKENASDDAYIVTSWLVDPGSSVRAGEAVVEVETSKSTVELISEATGRITMLHAAGSRVSVGEPIAIIAASDLSSAEVEGILSAPGSQRADDAPTGRGSTRFSAAARALMEEKGLDEKQFDGDGLVTTAMVRARAGAPATGVSSVGTTGRIDGSAVVIVGGGGHAAIVIELIRTLRSCRIAGILDDDPDAAEVLGIPVLGGLPQLSVLRERGIVLAVNAIAGIGHRSVRERVWAVIKDAGFGVPTLVHPSAVVEPSSVLEEGVQVLAGAYVGSRAVAGVDSIISSHAIVSHDCVVGEHAFIAPGAVLAGDVHVGANSLVGMGSTVFMGVRIGGGVVVGNGAAVLVDVPDLGVVRAGTAT